MPSFLFGCAGCWRAVPGPWPRRGDHRQPTRFAAARRARIVSERRVRARLRQGQETLLAALRAAASFTGRSSERTWLTGILKNKLVDRMCQAQRARLIADLGQQDECLAGLYDRAGHWKAGLQEWVGDPAKALGRREFWEAFQHCLARPPTTACARFFPPGSLTRCLRQKSVRYWAFPRLTNGP